MPEKDISEPDRLKNIEDKLTEIKDMQNIIELDVINLKNELEKIKLVSPSPIPPEVEERIVELEKISKDVDMFKEWGKTVEEVKFLRSKIMGIEKGERPPAKPIEIPEIEGIRKQIEELRKELAARPAVPSKPPAAPEIEEIRKEIGEMRKELAARPAVPAKPAETTEIEEIRRQIADLKSSMLLKPGAKPPDTGDLRKAIEENRRIIEDLRGGIPKEKVSVPGLNKLKIVVEENSRSIENLKLMVKTKHHTEVIPDVNELKKTIEENRHVIEDIRSRMSEAKPTGSSSLDTRVTELIDMVEGNRKIIEDLKVRVIKAEGRGGAGPSERMEDEIEELRNLLYSKLSDLHATTGDVRTEELKKMITENREAMEELKERVHATRTKKGVEFPLPMKERIGELEKEVVTLGKRMEKAGLKPIELPKGMKFPSEGPPKVLARKLDKMKANVDDLLKRMKTSEIYTKSLVRKEDLVALERTLKPKVPSEKERKIVSEDVYKDLENTKKAVVRNEDHINNLASDIEQLKNEISTVEKREWGEVTERPKLEDLIRRIEEIEHRLKSIGTSAPVFIE
ncbi:MAG: hypothetical protein GTN39_03050 [Candidatus Aenigmarchaeota archaeon]|nr:hypothetical protein [Candidatus Aenigmarchaeota archaeon]